MVSRDGDRRGAPARLPAAARRTGGRDGPAAPAAVRPLRDAGRPRCTASRAGSPRLRALGIGVPRDRVGRRSRSSPSSCEHPGAGAMLVDTGFHPSIAVTPHEAFGRLAGRVIKDVRMEPEQAVSAQLRALGIEPAEVKVRGDDAPPLRPRERHRRVPRVDLRGVERGVGGGRLERAPEGLLAAPVRPRLRLAHARLRVARRRIVRHLRPRVRPVRRRQRARWSSRPATPPATCRWCCASATATVLLTGDAAYTRRTLEESRLPYRMEDEHRFRRSLQGDPALHAREPGRARDLRARLRAVARAARRCTSRRSAASRAHV